MAAKPKGRTDANTPAYRLNQHIVNWKDCTRCPLYALRDQVCLYRGDIPADVLFIGEAPGESEDAIGQPFIGPCGKLLDRIIEETENFLFHAYPDSASHEFSHCITNIIGCAPFSDEPEEGIYASSIGKPPNKSIEACRPRVLELIALCQPQLIITVGDYAKKQSTPLMNSLQEGGKLVPIVYMVHPAWILRQGSSVVEIKRAYLKLASAVRECVWRD